MMDTKEALKELEDLTVDYGDRNEEQIARLDEAIDMAMDALRNLPNRLRQAMDTISRKEAVEAIKHHVEVENDYTDIYHDGYCDGIYDAIDALEDLPSAQPKKRTEERTETHACDLISRQAILKAINNMVKECDSVYVTSALRNLEVIVADVPSAQPERTCVNCGRTANNGGWYADGRTRCPIEEHYALPKDGYCHLWEKRNVTDDDYPERREDERPDQT